MALGDQFKFYKKTDPPGLGSRDEFASHRAAGTTSTYHNPGSQSTNYYALDSQNRRQLQVTVEHHAGRGSTTLPPKEALSGTGKVGQYASDAWHHSTRYDKDRMGTTPMFMHESTPAHTEVDWAVGTRGAGQVAMAHVIGIAANDALREGRHLAPSTDLSEHSGRLVEKLGGTNPNLHNTLDFTESIDYSGYMRDPRMMEAAVGQEIPRTEVKAGLSLTRSLRRKNRQAEQGRLF